MLLTTNTITYVCHQEIEDACRKIMKEAQNFGPDAAEIKCLPLYSTLPPQQQQKIFEAAPPPRTPGGPPGRKLIVSTSIPLSPLTPSSAP
jgi:pre-mRNA-splicing factor ATP-dependent RNA helicase DHX15/PRP43